MRKNIFGKVLLSAALALLFIACTKDEETNRKVVVLLPDAGIIDRWATDKANLETVLGKYNFSTTVYTAPETTEGAMELLKKYINSGELVVVSGKKEYSQVKAASWNIADGKKAMKDRLNSYSTGQRPDMVLAANDNLAQGAIEALSEAGFTDMPVITGQDNTAMAQSNIKSGKQAMTIDKNLEDMAYNTAMIINSLISGLPVQSSQSIPVGSVNIPVFYSMITLMTIDSY